MKCLILISLVFLNIPFEKQSSIFTDYLEETHNLNLAKYPTSEFLIINLNGCQGCISYYINEIFNSRKKIKRNKFVILSYLGKVEPAIIGKLNEPNVLKEKRNQFFRTSISPNSDVFIELNNKKINNITELNLGNFKEVFSEFLD